MTLNIQFSKNENGVFELIGSSSLKCPQISESSSYLCWKCYSPRHFIDNEISERELGGWKNTKIISKLQSAFVTRPNKQEGSIYR
jgi:hypothetical protein